MDEAPLPYLRGRVQPGAVEFLNAARGQGLRLAVLSDYPAAAKLKALGLDQPFDLVLSAQDPSVGVFKPNPRGLLAIAEQFGLRPEECLYIGDRPEVDAAAATAAGMPSLILNSEVDFPRIQQLVFEARPRVAQPLLDLA
jgi:phosphoglycolate phosphatase/putative hydrolase of the HAD superfamily